MWDVSAIGWSGGCRARLNRCPVSARTSYSAAAPAARPPHCCPSLTPCCPPTSCPIAAFLVVADEQFGRQIPFAFLEKVREEWQQKWVEKGPAATAHSLDKSFGPRLKYWMEYCEQHPEELSKVASVQKKVRWGGRVAG